MGKTRNRKDHTRYGGNNNKKSNYNNHQYARVKQQRQPAVELKQAPVSDSVMQDITKNRDPEIRRNRRGDIIYACTYIGDDKYEYWVEYDNSSRPLSFCDNRGYEWKCKYNSKGNISDYWDNTGYQEKYFYFANNLVIRKNSFGEEIKKHISRDKFITRETFIKTE
jgi:hypothetical protein